MKTKVTYNLKKRFLIPGAITALALVAAPVVMHNITADVDGFISTSYAAGGEGKGGGGQGKGKGGGGHDSGATTTSGGSAAAESKGKGGSAAPRGRRSLDDVLRAEAEEGEEDSDRPEWAGVPGKEGKPGGGSAGGDTKKGGDYGDLWVILRDDNGVPILNDGGFVQPLDAEGNLIELDAEGNPVVEGLTQEVEFGRLNIARSPDKVLDHALAEAISKLDGLLLTEGNIDDYIDAAGRLVDASGNTIDSPLESLALYKALVNGVVDDDGNIVISVTASQDGGSTVYTLTVRPNVAMDLAASAFAAASDKTGTISIDEVAYISGFLDVNITQAVENYTYDRTKTYEDTTVWILVETSPGIFEPEKVYVLDVVTFNDIPAIDDDKNGIDTFTQATDDALQVLEYIHDNALEQ